MKVQLQKGNHTSRILAFEPLETRQLLFAPPWTGDQLVAEGEPVSPNAVPDFALVDVNPNSISHNTEVSPRDYRGQISAWYFTRSF
jgi:hypothetical protein